MKRRDWWDGHDEHPARKRRRRICLLCQGPTEPDGWCRDCGVFPPRTAMERTRMIDRLVRFPGLLVNNGPHSVLISPNAAARIARGDFAARKGVPSVAVRDVKSSAKIRNPRSVA